MADTTTARGREDLSRWKLFLALSRTSHGILDLAAPALGALLGLGALPLASVMVLGLLTAFAGYTSVYALNDLIDWKADRERLRTAPPAAAGDPDAVFTRHPLAQGYLSYGEGLFWVCAWALLALVGAWRLRPICAAVFLVACGLEAVYCMLLRVHPLRTLVSGLVKSSGPVAAVLAVDPHPSPLFLAALFAWVFLWEIGGQNVPNDWSDLAEDRRVGARTIPVLFGERGATAVIGVALAAAMAVGALALRLSPGPFGASVQATVLATGLVLLAAPVWELRRSPGRAGAAALFNRASWYPVAVLAIVLARLAL